MFLVWQALGMLGEPETQSSPGLGPEVTRSNC